MNVLVTGATGYIGSCLVKRLLHLGHDVTAIILKGTDTGALAGCAGRVRECLYDGSLASLTDAVCLAKPQVAIHVASLFIVNHKPTDVDNLIASNVLFPTQLLEVMEHAGCRSIVNVGTSWQHYLADTYNPVNLYAATKQAFEDVLEYFVQARDFKAITLKLFDTYGPGDNRPKLFALLRRSAKDGTTLKMSPGNQMIDVVFIEDILDAFVGAMERVTNIETKEVFGICTEQPIQLRALADIYAEVVGKTLAIEWGGLPYRPREVMTVWNGYKLLPGWTARTSLRDGIARMERDPKIGGLLCSGKTP